MAVLWSGEWMFEMFTGRMFGLEQEVRLQFTGRGKLIVLLDLHVNGAFLAREGAAIVRLRKQALQVSVKIRWLQHTTQLLCN